MEKVTKSYKGAKVGPSMDREKQNLTCLFWFCVAVWYFTADILGIYSFLLSLAILVFGFFLVIFFSWCQEDLSHFRASRWSKKHLQYRFFIVESHCSKCFKCFYHFINLLHKNNCKPE